MNHLPIFTSLRVNGEDAFPRLRALIDDPDGLGAEPIRHPVGVRRGGAAPRVRLLASATCSSTTR